MSIQFNKRLQEHLFTGYMWVEGIFKILLFCKISKSICISLGSDCLSHSKIKTTNAWPLKGLSNNRQSKQTKGWSRGKESKLHAAVWEIKEICLATIVSARDWCYGRWHMHDVSPEAVAVASGLKGGLKKTSPLQYITVLHIRILTRPKSSSMWCQQRPPGGWDHW